MAQHCTTSSETAAREQALLHRLLGLYEEERRIYCQVLDLSRRQGELVRNGASLVEVRRLLEQKKTCLEIVGRMELTERNAKIAWERGRSNWTATGRNRLHTALKRVTDLIEEILVCEESNDLHLIEQAQGMG